MTQHSIDEVHGQVSEMRKKLEAGGGVASQNYIDGKFKNVKEEKEKEEATQLEIWSKALDIGLDEVVKGIQDFKINSIEAWSGLGALITGFVVSNVVDKDALTVKALDKVGLKRDESGIPRRKSTATVEVAPEAPVTTIDVDRVKNMRSAAISLSRSLNDLTKDVNEAARQIA